MENVGIVMVLLERTNSRSEQLNRFSFAYGTRRVMIMTVLEGGGREGGEMGWRGFRLDGPRFRPNF